MYSLADSKCFVLISYFFLEKNNAFIYFAKKALNTDGSQVDFPTCTAKKQEQKTTLEC